MPYLSHAQRQTVDVDAWNFDAKPEIVASHLTARSMERKVMLGCGLIGLTGIVILLAIVISSAAP